MLLKKYQFHIYLIGIFSISFAVFAYFYHNPIFFDPDRLYHFGLLQWCNQNGIWIPRTLPQFPFLGWDQYFDDKEFFFHLLLQPLYRLGGEPVVEAAIHFIAISIILIPLFFLKEKKSLVLWLGFLILLGNPNLAIRFSMLRPHVLAACLFTGMLWSTHSGTRFALFLFTLIFTLSYHAHYLVLLFFFGILLTSYIGKDQEISKITTKNLMALLLTSLAIGLIINPYFPSNIIRGIQHLGIALRGNEIPALGNLRLGSEIPAVSAVEWVRRYASFLYLLVIGIYLLDFKNRLAHLPLFLCIVFTFASFRSPRALEFLVPCLILLIYESLKPLPLKKILMWLAIPILMNIYSYHTILNLQGEPYAPRIETIKEAIHALPSDRTVTVYHCNWGLAPYLYYLRPNAILIDVLDPTFLLLANPKIFFLRSQLNLGQISDPFVFLKREFKADYVFCENWPLVHQIKDKAQRVSHDQSNTIHLLAL